MNEERTRELMMAALDGECDDDERAKLDAALATNEELRAEWRELQRVKELTTMMSMKKPPGEVWDGYWGNVYARLERGVAWIFVSVGAIVLFAWGIWQLVTEIAADTNMPTFIKLALAALLVGIVILGVSVVREKLFVRRHDPYKDIER